MMIDKLGYCVIYSEFNVLIPCFIPRLLMGLMGLFTCFLRLAFYDKQLHSLLQQFNFQNEILQIIQIIIRCLASMCHMY